MPQPRARAALSQRSGCESRELRRRCSHLSLRRKRGAHVGLVGGVGARPVCEVGDKEEGGLVVVGVEEEDSGGQALAPGTGVPRLR